MSPNASQDLLNKEALATSRTPGGSSVASRFDALIKHARF